MDAPAELTELSPPEPGIAAYTVAASADREAAARILDWLPDDCSLGFFDATEPKGKGVLEHGTYFVLRRRGPGWQITGGNHGWSHGIAEITHRQAVAFLHYCFPSNAGPYPNCLIVQKNTLRRESPWSGKALKRRILRIAGEERSWWEEWLARLSGESNV